MRFIILKEGFTYSPLVDAIPRNAICLCGSGKKWKKCHLHKLEIASIPMLRIHVEILEAYRAGKDTTEFFKKKYDVPA